MTSKVTVLGAGSWGTALAMLLAPHEPWLWDHNDERARQLQRTRHNERYLPAARIPEAVRITGDLQQAVVGADVIVISTPSHAVRSLAARLHQIAGLHDAPILVNTAKGLEEASGKRMSTLLLEEFPAWQRRIVSLVGPSHAEEVALGMPTTVVVAGEDLAVLERVQTLFTGESFRVYTNLDLVGVEFAVSVKNVIAIAAGICDGLGFGDNSKGALLTRGLAEIARLGMALGARAETFAGLAGLGDLVTTAISRHSRNRNLGERIGRGQTLQDALASMTQVVEGIRTTRAVCALSQKHGIEMPITAEVFAILFENKNPKLAIRDLMLRTPKPEMWSTSKGEA